MAKKGKAQKRTVRIEVRQSDVHGRGVYATQFVPKGTRIIEYTGERTSWEAAPNDARWINHSCDPNCEAAEEDDRIFIDAMRDIAPGEELFYDYALEIDEPVTEEAKKKYACNCGSSKCRGTMLDASS
jgi:uncharacterized protein